MNPTRYQELREDQRLNGSDDLRALWVIGRTCAATLASVYLSFRGDTMSWVAGQALLGASLLQWFILLHDFGHNRFFKRTWMNDTAGHLASILIIVPFYPWRYIHAHHHVWTGWKDKDPTMSAVNVTQIPRAKVRVVDFCWRWWIPIFSLAFSFTNFWNLKKLFGIWRRPGARMQFLFSIALLIAAGIVIPRLLGWPAILHGWGAGYLLFLVLSDPLLICQHSHVPQNRAGSSVVRPVHPIDQEKFTRSLIFPKWVSRWLLLGFDNHIVHHYFPAMPCYRLVNIDEPSSNQIHWWSWLKNAKAMPAHRLLFQDSRETGIRL